MYSECINSGFFIQFFTQYNAPEGYVAIGFGVEQIMIFSFMGTVVELLVSNRPNLVKYLETLGYHLLTCLKSAKIRDEIAAFEWYLLPLNQRRIYQFLLQHAQQEQVLHVAKIKPLNMEWSVSVSCWIC